MERQNGELDIIGDPTFLQMERRVHQMARRLERRPMRLEATYWSAPTMCSSLPSSWMLGCSNIVGIQRNFKLLQERIIDCWIAGLPDLPTSEQPDLESIILTEMPVFFTCAAGHLLLKKSKITVDDIAAYPSLALPSGANPLVEKALKSIGLWNDGVRMTRYRRDQWEGKTEADVVIGYGTPLSMLVSGGALKRLPLLAPFRSGDALVFRSDLRSDSQLDELRQHLLARVKLLRNECPEIKVAQS